MIGVERVCEPEEVDDGLEYLAADGVDVSSAESLEGLVTDKGEVGSTEADSNEADSEE